MAEAETTQTDNLANLPQEPSLGDNSGNVGDLREPDLGNEDLEQEVAKELEGGQEVPGVEVKLPEKFKSTEALVKSYEESQSQNTKLSQELSELRKKAEIVDNLAQKQEEMAKVYGFESFKQLEDYQTTIAVSKQVVDYEADQYARYIDNCEYPDEVRNLLVQYRATPTAEILECIEAEMPISAIKEVAQTVKEYKNRLQQHGEGIRYQQEIEHAKKYIENVTQKYSDRFSNPAFTNLFGEAFRVLGANLDADQYVSLVDELKQSYIKEYIEKRSESDTTDILSALSPGGGSPKTTVGKINLDKISSDEMDKIVGKLV